MKYFTKTTQRNVREAGLKSSVMERARPRAQQGEQLKATGSIRAGSPSNNAAPEDGRAPTRLSTAATADFKVCNQALRWFGAFLILMAAGLASVVGATETTVSPGPIKEVILVFKTHFDIGYTDLASNIVTKYRTTMMDQALKVVDQNRDLPPAQQFVWTIPGWPMHKILEDWTGQSPERKQLVMQAFKDGRFAVHALPFTTHTELLEAEDLVRGLEFSSALSRASGKPLPRDAKMTDVPSHSWILPTLLRHAGVEFLHLGCNAASSSPQVPRLFWWEGPDGSRLLTMYTAESYGTGLLPPKDWPHQTWLALIHTGDNHGPPTPEEVRALLGQAKRDLPGVSVRIGRLSDFADAILAEKPDLSVVRGDMPDTWIHGPLADPRGARMARNLRPALAAADCLGTELAGWGIKMPDHKAALADAYESSLLYGEHTWGGAFTWIYGKYVLKFGEEWQADRAAGKFQRIESSWDEHTAYIEQAQKLVAPVLAGELQALASGVKVAGKRVVVFNPLPWKRSGLVAVSAKGEPGPLTDVATGKLVPTDWVESEGMRFVAADVPPGGYKTFALRTPSKRKPATDLPSSSGNIIENKFFKLTFDPARGTVSSWIDKRTGRELADSHAPQAFGQYLHERFDRDQVQAFVKAYVKISDEWGVNELGKPSMPPAAEVPYRASSPTNFTLRIQQSGIATTATLSASAGPGLAHGITTKYILYRDLPFLDLELTVHDKPLDAWPEAGWLCLPFNVDEPQFRLARLGAVIDPAKNIVVGCNFEQIALNGGLTVAGRDGGGVGLCALDSPLVSLGEPGGWKYSKAWTPRKGRVFVNLFNNQWTTNFRLWNSGTWTSRVRLWPVSGENVEQNLAAPSDEARSPLLAGLADGPAGRLSATQAGLTLSRGGVKVTAFGANPDGDGMILRLWEEAGLSGSLQVNLPAGLRVRSVQPVDLRGRPTGTAIPVNAGRFETPIQGFAPVSFSFELNSAK